MDGNESGRHKGPAHARKRALPREHEERLAEIGRQVPPPKEEGLEIIAGLRASRRRRRLLTWGTALIIAALCAGAIAQWVRPMPHATFQTREVRLPGIAPSFGWPSSGEAAATVDGVGTVGQVRGSQSVPVAGLAELLAAYVVLSDHRLAPGGDGPAIPVTADAFAAYQVGQARQETEVPIAAGESLTELQALEGLLVDSGADMATVLADWDAGSVSAFVAKMNAAASMLGLHSTHITDPSGVDPATTSTAEDLVRLGEASLSIPVLRQLVSLAQASVPMTTVVYNPNFDLGHDGIIGIKTASDSSAQGCYLFAAQQNIGGKDVTVIGAVLGQQGGALGPNTAAVDAGDALGEERLRCPAQLHHLRSRPEGRRGRCSLGFEGSRDRDPAGRRDRVAGSRCHLGSSTPPFGWPCTERVHGRDVASGSGTYVSTGGAADCECALRPRGVVASDALSRAREVRLRLEERIATKQVHGSTERRWVCGSRTTPTSQDRPPSTDGPRVGGLD